MTSVYVVTSGSYSDYQVEGIFDTREGAEEFRRYFDEHRRKYSDESNEVEVYPLNPLVAERQRGESVYFVIIADDSTVRRCEESIDGPAICSALAEPWKGWVGDGSSSGFVLARDEVHAIKVLSERRARFLAGACP